MNEKWDPDPNQNEKWDPLTVRVKTFWIRHAAGKTIFFSRSISYRIVNFGIT